MYGVRLPLSYQCLEPLNSDAIWHGHADDIDGASSHEAPPAAQHINFEIMRPSGGVRMMVTAHLYVELLAFACHLQSAIRLAAGHRRSCCCRLTHPCDKKDQPRCLTHNSNGILA